MVNHKNNQRLNGFIGFMERIGRYRGYAAFVLRGTLWVSVGLGASQCALKKSADSHMKKSPKPWVQLDWNNGAMDSKMNSKMDSKRDDSLDERATAKSSRLESKHGRSKVQSYSRTASLAEKKPKVIIFLIKGMTSSQVQNVLHQGAMPGFQRYFLNGGSKKLHYQKTVFPSNVLSYRSSLLSGTPVFEHGLIDEKFYYNDELLNFTQPTSLQWHFKKESDSLLGRLLRGGSKVLVVQRNHMKEINQMNDLFQLDHKQKTTFKITLSREKKMISQLHKYLVERPTDQWADLILLELEGLELITKKYGVGSHKAARYIAQLDGDLNPIFQVLESRESQGAPLVAIGSSGYGLSQVTSYFSVLPFIKAKVIGYKPIEGEDDSEVENEDLEESLNFGDATDLWESTNLTKSKSNSQNSGLSRSNGPSGHSSELSKKDSSLKVILKGRSALVYLPKEWSFHRKYHWAKSKAQSFRIGHVMLYHEEKVHFISKKSEGWVHFRKGDCLQSPYVVSLGWTRFNYRYVKEKLEPTYYCPSYFDQKDLKKKEAYIIPLLSEFFWTSHSPGVVITAAEGISFEKGVLAAKGGLSFDEVWTPLWIRNLKLTYDQLAVPSHKLLSFLGRVEQASSKKNRP